jgi:hypothetical protein
MTDTSHPDLHRIVSRLRHDGDTEAADVIEKVVSDLALSEQANEALETRAALSDKAREDTESRNDFLIQEIEAAIARAKSPEPKP